MILQKFFNSQNIVIILILTLGVFLRFYNLENVPAGFFTDEASIGYNAYTILTKGTDQSGTFLPFFINSFANPVMIYASVPTISLLGLNEFSTRLSSALFGSLTILAIYLLSRELFKENKYKNYIAIFSAFFLSISPWHIHFSRIAFDTISFPFFTILGLFFFLKSQKNIMFIFLSTLMFSISIYTYYPARIFIPLFLLFILVIYFRFVVKNIKMFIISTIFMGILLIPITKSVFFENGIARWNQVDIFSHIERGKSVTLHVLDNYLSHFSLNFLFFKGDIGMPGQSVTRHSVRGIGELYPLQLPLIILGLMYLYFKEDKKTLAIIILWLILYPVGSMFTLDESAQATRSIVGVVPFQILSGIGLYYLFTLFYRLKKPLNYFSTLGIIIVIFASFIFYLDLYFIKYPKYSSDFWGWQFGARDIVKYFVSQQSRYDELIMAPEFNAPEIFFKFYAPNNCTKCRIGLPDVSYNLLIKQLFAVTPTYLQNNPSIKFKTQKAIYYPNNTIAFSIGEIVQ